MAHKISPGRIPAAFAGEPSCTPMIVTIHNTSQFQRIEKGRANRNRPLSSFFVLYAYLDGELFLVNFEYCNALVEAAVLANLMGRFDCAAVCASAHCGHFELPYSGAAGIPSCFRRFCLWYCHVGTSFNELPVKI
jgi:hypothetical protein